MGASTIIIAVLHAALHLVGAPRQNLVRALCAVTFATIIAQSLRGIALLAGCPRADEVQLVAEVALLLLELLKAWHRRNPRSRRC